MSRYFYCTNRGECSVVWRGKYSFVFKLGKIVERVVSVYRPFDVKNNVVFSNQPVAMLL